jgi:nucleotide-binding universal stress UspA family protein
MKRNAARWALLAALLVPASTWAQEEGSERGDLLYMQTIKVMPSDARAYEAVMAKIAGAAELAGLGHKYAWTMMNTAFTYTMVFPFEDFSYWDDPQQWMRQFQGTEGEEKLQEAIQEFYRLDTRVVASEVLEHVKEWSYQPEASERTKGFANITEFWLKSGKEQQYGELVKDVVTVLEEIGYPYPITGHRVHFGDSGRTVFVTWYDDRASYYGVNSLERLLREKDALARWGELLSRLPELVLDLSDRDATIKPRMSYWPEQEGGTRQEQ